MAILMTRVATEESVRPESRAVADNAPRASDRASGMPFLRRAICAARIALAWLVLLVFTAARLRPGLARVDLKAVFLFNFAQFVEWPADTFPEARTPFVIGILGTDPFKGALQTVVRNETVRDRPVVMRRYDRVEQVSRCHILFIGASEARRLPQILTALRGRPVLTVSELDDFARQGGMIRFVTESGRVRLRINNDAARAAGLMISTKLLRVAEVASPEPKE